MTMLEPEPVIGAGELGRIGGRVARRLPHRRIAVISDADVWRAQGAAMSEGTSASAVFTFAAGEANKTREMWARLSDELLAAGYGRDSVIIALGGGVTTDLAGFVAATYMRGVPVVHVPTSLLAMIDAAHGGKVGVDTPAGKNLIGAFHPPALVVIDPLTLRTLPDEHLRAGMAEAVKHGAIADAAHLEWIVENTDAIFDRDIPTLTMLIERSVGIKLGVVESDPREAGPRKLLNFGHTIAHAIELISNFEVLHGEAVAIGMVAEALLGERLGVTETGTADALSTAVEVLGLPMRLPAGMAPAGVVDATRTDKKARAGLVEYALIERIGAGSAGCDGRWSHPVADAVVVEVLAGLSAPSPAPRPA